MNRTTVRTRIITPDVGHEPYTLGRQSRKESQYDESGVIGREGSPDAEACTAQNGC